MSKGNRQDKQNGRKLQDTRASLAAFLPQTARQMALCDFVWEFESARKNYLLERRTRRMRIAFLQSIHTGFAERARIDGDRVHFGDQ